MGGDGAKFVAIVVSPAYADKDERRSEAWGLRLVDLTDDEQPQCRSSTGTPRRRGPKPSETRPPGVEPRGPAGRNRVVLPICYRPFFTLGKTTRTSGFSGVWASEPAD